jgi:hypothetical protein
MLACLARPTDARKKFLYHFKAGQRAAALGQPHSYQLVDCSYIATGPLARDDGYSTASRD